jgi:hypothetical protein
MAPLEGPGQVPDVEVRVGLRRVDTGVAEDGLDVAQVRPGAQEMGREAVAKRVRRDRACDPGFAREDRDAVLDRRGRQAVSRLPAAKTDEEEGHQAALAGEGGPGLLEIVSVAKCHLPEFANRQDVVAQ